MDVSSWGEAQASFWDVVFGVAIVVMLAYSFYRGYRDRDK
jgi:hypothetical protein